MGRTEGIESILRRGRAHGADGLMKQQRVVISNVFGDSNRGGTAITSVAITLIESRLPAGAITLIPIVTSDESVASTHRHVVKLHPSAEITAPLVRERPGRIGRMHM